MTVLHCTAYTFIYIYVQILCSWRKRMDGWSQRHSLIHVNGDNDIALMLVSSFLCAVCLVKFSIRLHALTSIIISTGKYHFRTECSVANTVWQLANAMTISKSQPMPRDAFDRLVPSLHFKCNGWHLYLYTTFNYVFNFPEKCQLWNDTAWTLNGVDTIIFPVSFSLTHSPSIWICSALYLPCHSW